MLLPSSEILVGDLASLKEAMSKIEASGRGFVICCDKKERVMGVLTDGDIRRAMLSGLALNDKITPIINETFIHVNEGCPRESILKLLDHKIKFVPVLNKNSKLIGIVTPETLSLDDEKGLCYRSRAPVRISFGGGGSDLSHYFYEMGGAVLNSAISLYCHASMIPRPDAKVIIKSDDLNITAEADSVDEFIQSPGPLKLFAAILSLVKPKFGFEITIRSDYPVGSGLGGSATAAIAFVGCFNLTRTDKWDKYEVAEIAYQAERLSLGISGGWQDQYAASFGGFNFMEFAADDNIINQLRLDDNTKSELEANLLLCDLGSTRESGLIHESQKRTMESSLVKERVKANVEICFRMKNSLMRGRLSDFGYLLHEAWSYKKTFSNEISNKQIDGIYEGALEQGALGGKLLGAGGGGFFLFLLGLKGVRP